MQAVILVGGEGTRLRPLTCNRTKAMVPVLNRPFLEHMLIHLRKHGIKDVILAMGYLPGSVQSYFGDGNRLGIKITYLVEETPLGTAGAVKNAESLIDGPFFVFNGDILTDIDLTAMMKRHHRIKPIVSIALTPVDNPSVYGVVETNARGRVKRFVEKPSRDKVTTNMINAGIYILEPEVLNYIPASTRYMFEHHLFPLLLDKGEHILSYPSKSYWIDIGTPQKYLKAHHDLLLKWRNRIVRIEGGSQIHPTASIEGPVLICEGCVISAGAKIKGPAVIGPRCYVESQALVNGAVLWHDCKVGERAILKNCVVASHSHVKADCKVLDYCVLGDNVTLSERDTLPRNTRVWPDGQLEPSTASP